MRSYVSYEMSIMMKNKASNDVMRLSFYINTSERYTQFPTCNFYIICIITYYRRLSCTEPSIEYQIATIR